MENPFKKAVENNENTKNNEIKDETENNNTTEEVQNVSDNSQETKESISNNNETVEKEEIKDSYKEKYEQLNNQYIRLAADFDNYRKRQEQEREAIDGESEFDSGHFPPDISFGKLHITITGFNMVESAQD